MNEKELNDEQFEVRISGKSQHYSENDFFEKVKKHGMKIGLKTLHGAMTLFYTLKDPELPKKDRLIIIGALGYLILPVDLIPDFIPVVGFADDAAVIISALSRVASSVKEDHKLSAHIQLKKWFKDKYTYDGEDNIGNSV